MEAQLTHKEFWYEVDGPMGTEWVPENVVGYIAIGNHAAETALADYCENPITLENLAGERVQVSRVFGYGVRSSMPGYMDCTPWTVYQNLREARKAYNAEVRANRGED